MTLIKEMKILMMKNHVSKCQGDLSHLKIYLKSMLLIIQVFRIQSKKTQILLINDVTRLLEIYSNTL